MEEILDHEDEEILDREDEEILDHEIIIAAFDNDLQMVIKLLSDGADPNVRYWNNGYTNHEFTPLHFAASAGNLQMVCALLEGGSDPNSRSDGEWTVLHWAAEENHFPVVKKLLQWGSNPTLRNDCGKTPLDYQIVQSAWYELDYLTNRIDVMTLLS
jgi:ankyrin repeat protein